MVVEAAVEGKSGEALLAPGEREQWDRDGYLHLRQVLSPAEVEAFRNGTDEAVREFGRLPDNERPKYQKMAGNQTDLRFKNVLGFSTFMDSLIDHPDIFRRALALMGPYIQVCSTEILLRRPRRDRALPLHLDGGPSLDRILPHPAGALLSMKALVFLTDVSTPDSGNVMVVPGSHQIPVPDDGPSDEDERIIQICSKAGDVLLFPWALWHGVAANLTDQTRVSLVVWYAQLWARPVDHLTADPSILRRLSPRQRLLLGDVKDPDRPEDYYMPSQEDYLQTMLGDRWYRASEVSAYVGDAEAFSSQPNPQ